MDPVEQEGEGRGLAYLVKFIKELRKEWVHKCLVCANVISEWPLKSFFIVSTHG